MVAILAQASANALSSRIRSQASRESHNIEAASSSTQPNVPIVLTFTWEENRGEPVWKRLTRLKDERGIWMIPGEEWDRGCLVKDCHDSVMREWCSNNNLR